jgi:ATP-binding cassette, subfamily C, bacterial CydD
MSAMTPSERAALRESGLPGARWFRQSAGWTTAATAAIVVQCGALSWLIAVGLAGHQHDSWPALALLAAAVLGRALAGGRARADAGRGGAAITAHVRRALLGAALPDWPRPAPGIGPDPAAIAHGAVELSADIAAYHERTWPSRAAAGPASTLVLICVAVINWPAAALLALSTPILPVNMRLAGMAAESASTRQLDQVRALSARLLDRFRGMHVLRTLGAAGREARTVRQACDDLNRATMTVLRRAFVSSAVMDLVVTFAIAITATYVGLSLLGYVHLRGVPPLNLDRGMFVLLLAPAYFAPLREYVAGYHERDSALAALARLGPLEEPREHVQPGPSRPLAGPPRLELAGVRVQFPGAEAPLLDGVTATAEPGQVIALTGASGAGKSTLLAILAGLRTPAAGHVHWSTEHPQDERPALQRPAAGSISWLGQHTVIIAGTIADNIRLGDPAAGRALASDGQPGDPRGPAAARAASDAGLGPLAGSLPAGLDTLVGDGGFGLSAGQARRVALARTLFSDRPLWILDEPTAHLDAATEQDILDRLLRAATGRTVIIATHSATVVERADVHWHLDAGRLLTTSPVLITGQPA